MLGYHFVSVTEHRSSLVTLIYFVETLAVFNDALHPDAYRDTNLPDPMN